MESKTHPERAQLLRMQFATRNCYLKPITMKEFEKIRPWRNRQMNILRQDHEITKEEQKAYAERYFDALAMENPESVLFSYWVGRVMRGYGGFVHIDWQEGSAEISYLVNPENKVNLVDYTIEWLMFLKALKSQGKILGITKWRAETFVTTEDKTRDLHITFLAALFGAEPRTDTGESVRQYWEMIDE